VDKIFRAIRQALKETEMQFKQKSNRKFRLGA
jgi:hypothetical protein